MTTLCSPDRIWRNGGRKQSIFVPHGSHVCLFSHALHALERSQEDIWLHLCQRVTHFAKKHCTFCHAKFDLVDKAGWKWFCQQHLKGAPVSSLLLLQKGALVLHEAFSWCWWCILGNQWQVSVKQHWNNWINSTQSQRPAEVMKVRYALGNTSVPVYFRSLERTVWKYWQSKYWQFCLQTGKLNDATHTFQQTLQLRNCISIISVHKMFGTVEILH